MKSKHRSLTLIALTCLALLGSAPANLRASTLSVTSAADNGPGSLRAAIKSSRSGDTITFSLPVPATITLTSGELVVSKNLNILGPGAGNLAISGNHASRVFRIAPRMTATIAGLTIANGVADAGAGIYGDHATLTVSNCIVTGNSTTKGSGAGIYSDGSLRGGATLTIANSIITGNSAYNSGGGIENNGNSANARATIVNCEISGNSAVGGFGGGISSVPGYSTLNLLNCTVSANSAKFDGGGLSSGSSAATTIISHCTFSENSSSHGGAIHLSLGSLTVANSTLSGNSAMQGGGILNNGGRVTVLNSTLSGNSDEFWACIVSVGIAPTLTIGNSILDNNSWGEIVGGTVTSLGYNLCSRSGDGVLTQPTDHINTDPLLGPLQDNGGPTLTHAPLPGSPVIDQGKNFHSSPTDQRGLLRTFDFLDLLNASGGDATDIGAVEVQ
jgi:predicted outer membrane repeat protein